MQRRQSDKDSINGYRARTFLRHLELKAYAAIVSALMVQGDLTESGKVVLETVCSHLHISEDRRKAEIRRALCDADIKRAAEILHGYDAHLLWGLESQREVSSKPVAVPKTAIITATRHIMAAAVASKDITAYDVALHGLAKRPSTGYRSLFSVEPQEKLTVADLITGMEPEAPAMPKPSRREVVSRAIKSLCEAAGLPAPAIAEGLEKSTAQVLDTGGATSNVNRCVTSSAPPSSSSSSTGAASCLAMTHSAAQQLCDLAERLVKKEALPPDVRSATPVSTRGEPTNATTSSSTHVPPPSNLSPVKMDVSPEKKAPRKKVVRRGQSKPGDEKSSKLSSVSATTNGLVASPLKATGTQRKPRVTADGRPKQRRRKHSLPEVMVESKILNAPADLSLLSLPTMRPPPPPPPAPIVNEGIAGTTNTLDLLAGMAMEQTFVGQERPASISKTTASVPAALGVAKAAVPDPPPPPPLPPPAPSTAAATFTLPITANGLATTGQMLSPALAAALPSSAWLTNAISAVVPQSAILPGGGKGAAAAAAVAAAAAAAAAGTSDGSIPPLTADAAAVASAALHVLSTGAPGRMPPMPPLAGNPNLHPVSNATANRSSPVTINSASALPVALPIIPLTTQVYTSNVDTLSLPASFSSVRCQSESLAQFAVGASSVQAAPRTTGDPLPVKAQSLGALLQRSISNTGSSTDGLAATLQGSPQSDARPPTVGVTAPADTPIGANGNTVHSTSIADLSSCSPAAAVSGTSHQHAISTPSAESVVLPTDFAGGSEFHVGAGGAMPPDLKQVSGLVAGMTAGDADMAAMLGKDGSDFAASKEGSLLDGMAMSDDKQLADLIRMCQASDPSAQKMEDSELATVFSAVTSPEAPSGNTSIPSLEQIVSESSLLDSSMHEVSSALPGAVNSLPPSSSMTSTSAEAAPVPTSSVQPVLLHSLTDSTQLTCTSDDTVLMGEEHALDSGTELITEIVPAENGVSTDDDLCSDEHDTSVASPALDDDSAADEPAITSLFDQAILQAAVASDSQTQSDLVDTALHEQANSVVAAESSDAYNSASSAACNPPGMVQSSGSGTSIHSTGRRKRRSSEADSWVKTALGLMQRLTHFRGSNRPKHQFSASAWFLQPVNPKTAPGYFDIVKMPMDFGTIRKKLEDDAYVSYVDWLSDMQLVRSNCHLYNAAEHQAVLDCEEVFLFFETEFNKIKGRLESLSNQYQPAKKLRTDMPPT